MNGKIIVILFFFLGVFKPLTYSQNLVHGKIINKINEENLAFVPIQISGGGAGVLTDVDGKFRLQIDQQNLPVELKITYLGFNPTSIKIIEIPKKEIIIKLEPIALYLNEVIVRPGENPANKIITRVIENKEIHRPENLSAFSFTSYNKLFITTDLNAKVDSLESIDTSKQSDLVKFLNKQHLFLSESISERSYKYKNNYNEKILASRVSGFKSSPFTLLSTQLQSFSFYTEQIELLQMKYINPVAEGTFKRYNFTLEDTLVQKNDSIFVISFRPKAKAKFQGLKGVLYISTNGYAIQSVIAEPAEQSKSLSLKIRQNYTCINNQQWFPVQLNTDWIYNTVNVDEKNNTKDNLPKLKVVSRSYIKNIDLNPDLKKIPFNEIEIKIDKEADQKEDSFWNLFRTDSLNQKEKETYRFIDSIGEKEKFELKLKSYEALFSGEFPIGPINLQLSHLFRFNYFEGYRFGLGLSTGNKISEKIKLSAYGAYGTWDKNWKYGSEFTLFLSKKKEANLKLTYANDLIESAGSRFINDHPNFIKANEYRRFFLWKFDQQEIYQAQITFRTLRYFKIHLFANQQNIQSSTSHLVQSPELRLENKFNFNEVGLQVRFVFKEKFIQTQNRLISLDSKYPKLYLNYRKGLTDSWFGKKGDIAYDRIETKIEYSYNFLTFGKLNLMILASKVNENIPYTLLFAGQGSNLLKYGVSCLNTFETMGVNEFISSSQASIFINHHFGNIFPVSRKWNPQIELTHNMGIGKLKDPGSIESFGIRTMEKGYFESGIRIHRLLGSNVSSLGIGFFYRYGPYAKTDPKLNLAIKLAAAANF